MEKKLAVMEKKLADTAKRPLDMAIKKAKKKSKSDVIILGAGLAGLSAGFALSESGKKVLLLEKNPEIGGLAKTIVHEGFRFDLGGHRFFTNNLKIEYFIRKLLDKELLIVPRKSKIYLGNKYFDYPLKVQNAILGLGIPSTLRILAGYGLEKLKNLFKKNRYVSLEDWVVAHFGRPMFELYFKEYSEKVWGIKCEWISSEWVAQRIRGLSLSTAIKESLMKKRKRTIPTLADSFLYPEIGIGRIAERLKESIIKKGGNVLTETSIEQILHSNFKIKGVLVKNHSQNLKVEGMHFISSIPINTLIRILNPQAPDDVLEAATKLCYRSIVIVAVFINRPSITDLTWIYFPEKRIPFARIHEPTNWSKKMAPKDKTLIVAEYFCFENDKIWKYSDEEFFEITVHNLVKLGFIRQSEVMNTVITRVPNAYPLLEVGYRKYYEKVWEYLSSFKNLSLVGRTGRFEYRNIDHVIESGLETAESIIKGVTVAA
jgi:protoporphyrinogen oxidase